MKWCCKKVRGLFNGETDLELKSLMILSTRDRYQPHTRKAAMDIMMTMIDKADRTTDKKLMLALRADRVFPSISYVCYCVSCRSHCHELSHFEIISD